MLARNGADLNAKCHGTPPLHLAIATAVQPDGQSFGWDCVAALLENNANVSAKVIIKCELQSVCNLA